MTEVTYREAVKRFGETLQQLCGIVYRHDELIGLHTVGAGEWMDKCWDALNAARKDLGLPTETEHEWYSRDEEAKRLAGSQTV